MTDVALLEQIADQAKTVRRLQRECFRRHDRQTLEDSKAAERQLDRLLARREGIPEQAAFFTGEGSSP